MRHEAEQAFAEIDLSPAEAQTLVRLDPDLLLTRSELVERLGIEPSSLDVVINAMRQGGLVVWSNRLPGSKSAVLAMTDLGLQRRREARLIFEVSPVLTTLSAEQADRLRDLVWLAIDGYRTR
ncbi:hypothetical protein GCM10022251_74950 [Phytohabitans flavus]|uniref:HTH marR-type domain-containing protein n=1 Tax=Phytohabitans flavus TaxID=1076124 RepID=A0A6F8XLF7_9ACTN|nr:MarR family winged helix-turn-helix transcriptional regulator [Phytohabitans flavus]BCB74646.1 hypothetical protein Pflav_010560 [Phytohabitans flavus]